MIDPDKLDECVRYFFMLTSVTREDNGTYTLRATDHLGRTMLDVDYELMSAIVAAKWGKAPAVTANERRAPIQGDYRLPRGAPGRSRGSVTWDEHEEAYAAYAKRHGAGQSSERLAERGGFGYEEIARLLGHAPTTWAEAES